MTIEGGARWIKLHSTASGKTFFRHKNHRMFLEDFEVCPAKLKKYDGHQGDSYFSGILIKLSSDGESVKVFTYYC